MKNTLLFCALALTSTACLGNSQVDTLSKAITVLDQDIKVALDGKTSSLSLHDKRILEDRALDIITALNIEEGKSYGLVTLLPSAVAAAIGFLVALIVTHEKYPSDQCICCGFFGGAVGVAGAAIALVTLIDYVRGDTYMLTNPEVFKQLKRANSVLELIKASPTA